MRRAACVVLGVALVLGVASGCAVVPVESDFPTPTRTESRSAHGEYDVRLVDVIEHGDGTLSTSIFVPAYDAGVWLRFSELDDTFTRDVCQDVVEDATTSTSDACSVEVFERDEDGDLTGVVLHVEGIDEAGYFEVDARALRRTSDEGWSGKTGTRSVKLLGFLGPVEAQNHDD